jgi:hypothetical protein
MHSVVETPTYLRSAKVAGMTTEEMASAVKLVSERPLIGEIMAGTGGARKVRLGGRGKGKSGGYRIITYYAEEDVPVFLLDVYSKGDRASLTAAERNEIRGLLSGLADNYRASVQRRVRDRTERP